MTDTIIPTQLKNAQFCRVKAQTKKPFEMNWTNNLYSYDKIQNFFPQENYGVICGHNNLAVIDCDSDKLVKIVSEKLPKTFTIQTGGGGKHFYYFVPDLKKKLILNDPDVASAEESHLGEVQFIGQQVVGPGSTHPNGKKYEIVENSDIQEISLEKLLSVVGFFIKKAKEYYAPPISYLGSEDEIDKLKVLDIWGATKLKKHGNEFYGSHPIHGSVGGANFWINPEKNTWRCFRCDSGGGALAAIAVKEGIIDCADAQPGNLRGEKAKKAIKIAKEKYGLKNKQNYSYQEPPPPEAYEQDYIPQMPVYPVVIEERRIVSCAEVFQMKEEKEPFLIDRIIPKQAITMLSAESGKGKSMVMLKFAKAIATGEKLFDTFKVNKTKVLIVDMEMNKHNIVKRNRQVLHKIVDIDYYFLQEFKIDNPPDFKWLTEMIEKNGYGLVIFDTLSSIHSKEENSATEMAKINGLMLTLTRKIGISVFFLHHNAKTKLGERAWERGSTDIKAKVASHLTITKNKGKTAEGWNKNTIIMKQEKSRDEDEINKIKFDFYVDPNTDKIEWKYYGEIEEEKMAIDNVKENIVELLKDGEEMTIKEIKSFFEEAGTPHNRETITRALNDLEKIGTLIKYPGGTGKKDKEAREGSFALRTEEKEEADRAEKERDIFSKDVS